jgi:hypothetical protein
VRLIGFDGNGVTLRVIGYQFPDAESRVQRTSWLRIEGDATCAEGTWTFRYPALTPPDAVELSAWLRSAAAGAVPALAFIEPNLAFAVTARDERQVDVRVGLDLEYSPPWRKHTRAGDPFLLTCRLSPEQLRDAATDWDSEIAPYPP